MRAGRVRRGGAVVRRRSAAHQLAHQAARQGGIVEGVVVFGEVGLHQQLAAGVADRRALLKPALQRGGQSPGCGGHHEAAHVDIAFAQLVPSTNQRGPQAFEHGERAEVFACG